jgi:site-specific DNA-methyltransferase (adenine-specific)
MAILIALKKPTPGMKKEAAALGKWTMPGSKRSFPKLQIMTIEDYFDGKRPELPDTSGTLKKAERQVREKEKNLKLL